MAEQLVTAGGAEFYVEVADVGGRGPTTISDREPLSFDGVRDTVQAIATELVGVWDSVKPDEASVEFALKLTAKSGRLTGLVVNGGGEAALQVKMVWRRDTGPGSAADADRA